MMVALAGWVGQNHLHATVGGVVGSPAFFAKHVADAVGICFVKLRREREGKKGKGGISEDERDKVGVKRDIVIHHVSFDRVFSSMKY